MTVGNGHSVRGPGVKAFACCFKPDCVSSLHLARGATGDKWLAHKPNSIQYGGTKKTA
jgi:hypothetical protein